MANSLSLNSGLVALNRLLAALCLSPAAINSSVGHYNGGTAGGAHMSLADSNKALVTLGVICVAIAYVFGLSSGDISGRQKARPWMANLIQSQCQQTGLAGKTVYICPSSITEWPVDP